jgi:hypothetical protein
MVPLHFLTPDMQIPIVPLFINGLAPPLPSSQRCYALGRAVGDAIDDWPADKRVAVIGSGSFSLEIGGPKIPPGERAGTPDPQWVKRVQDHLEHGGSATWSRKPARRGLPAPAISAASCSTGSRCSVWLGTASRPSLHPRSSTGMPMRLGGWTDPMSIYAVNKLCREALRDAAFRAALKRDPQAAIAPLSLTEEERAALLHGDVAWLYERGAHPFLLAYLTRWELFGLTVSLYSERIRTAREPAHAE